MRLAYDAPQVTVVANLRDLTQGASSGSKLDKGFGSGTPVSQLTFSS